MNGEHNRYFIELQMAGTETLPRKIETETRREQASVFIATIYDWLKNHELDGKVSDMDVTAFGQVQITCDADIIHRIRDEEDILNIATIRPGAMFVEGIGRLAGQV